MKIKFLGSAQEVGRSCIQLKTEGKNFLLDCGLKILPEGLEFPIFPEEKVDAVFISHAHLDHTGALPLFNYKGLSCPIYGTEATKEITNLLLEDSYKISHNNGTNEYEKDNVRNVMNLFEIKHNNTKYDYDKKITYELYDAGHIPGSSSVVLEAEGKRILYTGDINTISTRLLNGADTNYGKIDVMICESTYGDRAHEPRKHIEHRFLKKVDDTISQGICLVPAFAVGRAQELLMILADNDFDNPTYLDGMAEKATKIFLHNPTALRDANALRKALRKVEMVDNFHEREEALHNNSIILTTSGMLNGGPVMNYLKKVVREDKNAILLTGYQAEESNGRLLLREHRVEIDGWETDAKCQVDKFDFSAHAGMNELCDLIKKVKPKKIIFNHGDHEPINSLAKFAREQGIEVVIPKLGEEIEI